MIENLSFLQEYLRANRMQDTLHALRQQLFRNGLTEHQPSQQLLRIVNESNVKVQALHIPQKVQHKSRNLRQNFSENSIDISMKRKSSNSSQNSKNKRHNELIVQGLLGKIAYSNHLIEDKQTNIKIEKMMNNRLFLKAAGKLFPQKKTILNADCGFHDELQFATVQNPCVGQHSMIIQESHFNKLEQQMQIQYSRNFVPQKSYSNSLIQNQTHKSHISNISIDQNNESILSQPSYVLEQLNKQMQSQEYIDDNDLGYHLLKFQDFQLEEGCAEITKKYAYPHCAVLKGTKEKSSAIHKENAIEKEKTARKNIKKKQSSKLDKFPQGVNFPTYSDFKGEVSNEYPIQFDKTVYDCMKLKVIFDRDKTGYEENEEIQFSIEEQVAQLSQQINQKNILAGKYQVTKILGCGVFAKVLKAVDLTTKTTTCLKMISNNRQSTTNQPTKDFFDQALDQIKLLKYIKANCNPDDHFLLNLKDCFYHREHLFLQTDLLKDNLYIAYKKNPHFFSISIIKQLSMQILSAISMLHSLHVMHADLKPQNILIRSYDDPVQIKVIDLGNSCFFHDQLGSYVQSRSYRAPEVILGLQYNQKIDIWSVGCILSELWTKNVLFYNQHVPGMLARIQSIIGPWPQWMLQQGKSCANFFSKENLIFMQEPPKMNILVPKKTSLANRIRTDDALFLDFLNQFYLESILICDPVLKKPCNIHFLIETLQCLKN